MGRPPIGRTAMSGAERAARHIAKLKASVPVAADDIVTNDIKPATMDVRKNLDAAIARIAELEADLAEWIKAGAGWRELQQQVDAMNTGGMFSRKEYKQIQECLHPDRVVGTPLERKYVE